MQLYGGRKVLNEDGSCAHAEFLRARPTENPMGGYVTACRCRHCGHEWHQVDTVVKVIRHRRGTYGPGRMEEMKLKRNENKPTGFAS